MMVSFRRVFVVGSVVGEKIKVTTITTAPGKEEGKQALLLIYIDSLFRLIFNLCVYKYFVFDLIYSSPTEIIISYWKPYLCFRMET